MDHVRRPADPLAQALADRDALEEFLTRLGHELRTPLNAALGFAQLLELDDLPGAQGDSVQRILAAGRLMSTLLDEVLDLARIRHGSADLRLTAVDARLVVEAVLELCAPQAAGRGVRLEVAPGGPLLVRADGTRLTQVLLNLVTNAVKFGRASGTVTVTLLLAGDHGSVSVTDDGTGLAPAALDRLFRPFERLDADRTGIPGTGMGLMVARALVTAMDGTLTASSELGVGTTMVVALPAP